MKNSLQYLYPLILLGVLGALFITQGQCQYTETEQPPTVVVDPSQDNSSNVDAFVEGGNPGLQIDVPQEITHHHEVEIKHRHFYYMKSDSGVQQQSYRVEPSPSTQRSASTHSNQAIRFVSYNGGPVPDQTVPDVPSQVKDVVPDQVVPDQVKEPYAVPDQVKEPYAVPDQVKEPYTVPDQTKVQVKGVAYEQCVTGQCSYSPYGYRSRFNGMRSDVDVSVGRNIRVNVGGDVDLDIGRRRGRQGDDRQGGLLFRLFLRRRGR